MGRRVPWLYCVSETGYESPQMGYLTWWKKKRWPDFKKDLQFSRVENLVAANLCVYIYIHICLYKVTKAYIVHIKSSDCARCLYNSVFFGGEGIPVIPVRNPRSLWSSYGWTTVGCVQKWNLWFESVLPSLKLTAIPPEAKPKPEYLLALATYLGVRW